MKTDIMVQTLYEKVLKLKQDTETTIKKIENTKEESSNKVVALENLIKDLSSQEAKLKGVINANMDEYNVINFLNSALRLEYNSIFDYQTYADSLENGELKKTLSDFGLIEMEHARLLSRKIVSLGGTPEFTPPKARKSKELSIEQMLKEHKEGEEQAIKLLENGLKHIKDPELDWFIGKLKLDEIEHLEVVNKLLAECNTLEKIITVSGKVKWHDDYVEGDEERPWIDS